MADKSSTMREAQKYLAKGQIDKAISEWERLLSEAPDGNIHNVIGDLHLKRGDKKNAADSYRKAANYFREEGFSLKALALYKKVLNINPSDADALYALGQLSEEKGLTTDAIKYYLASTDSLSKEGKKDRLLDLYQKILSLSPSNIPLRSKVAEIFLREGLAFDAAKEYVHIAGIYDDKGDTQKAKDYYQKALDMQPSLKGAVIGLARLYEKVGEIKDAFEHMKEASARFHSDPDILLPYAELCARRGYTDQAKDCFAKLIELNPDNPEPRRLLAELYMKAGQKERAWAEYLPVIDSMILEDKNEEAIRLLDSFRDVDPLESGKRLVSLYRKLGEDSRVVQELTALGDALKDRGLNDEALGCYRDAIEISPEDDHLKAMISELTRKPEAVQKAEDLAGAQVEKTAEEIFIEADIFSRYGLMAEATKLLEALKVREPHHIGLHIKLKSLYAEIADKEAAVTECLILSELYKRAGDNASSEQVLQEAININPQDPRLVEKGVSFQPEALVQDTREGLAGPSAQGPAIEDYEDEIAEADFYVRQGLTNEAAKILERLHGLFPDNRSISDRLDNLEQASSLSEPFETEAAFEDEPVEQAPPEKVDLEEAAAEEKQSYEDFMFTEQDLVDAQEMPEPVLDNDVLEVFQEFKKGLEKELANEDSETHYNLGIAYKEMGLVEDAIKEFQTSKNDPKRFIQSSSMLGVCYMEKGLYSLAIDVLSAAVKTVTEKDDSYWPMRYDLAEAHEKNNNLTVALDLYTSVYGWNAGFRDVAGKVDLLKQQVQRAPEREKEKPKGRKDRVSYL